MSISAFESQCVTASAVVKTSDSELPKSSFSQHTLSSSHSVECKIVVRRLEGWQHILRHGECCLHVPFLSLLLLVVLVDLGSSLVVFDLQHWQVILIITDVESFYFISDLRRI